MNNDMFNDPTQNALWKLFRAKLEKERKANSQYQDLHPDVATIAQLLAEYDKISEEILEIHKSIARAEAVLQQKQKEIQIIRSQCAELLQSVSEQLTGKTAKKSRAILLDDDEDGEDPAF